MSNFSVNNRLNLKQRIIVARMAADERVPAPYVSYIKQMAQVVDVDKALDILMDYVPDLCMELKNAPSERDPDSNIDDMSYLQLKQEWDRVVEHTKEINAVFDPLYKEAGRISSEIHIMNYVERRDGYYKEKEARLEDLLARCDIINFAYWDINHKLDSINKEVSFKNNITSKIRRDK